MYIALVYGQETPKEERKMKRKQDRRELVALLSSALTRQDEYKETFKGCDNPQVQAQFYVHKGRCEALSAVIDAAEGETVFLRLMGC